MKRKRKLKSGFVREKGETYFKDRKGTLWSEVHLNEIIEAVRKNVRADKTIKYYEWIGYLES